MVERALAAELSGALIRFPVVALVGPRQAGKTTLARALQKLRGDTEYLDLERPSNLARLSDPELYLTGREDRLAILDEVQQLPGLFPDLLNRSSESLAGRAFPG